VSYLLRVELEDRPGSLGALAVALGSVGADIVSLEVVERGDGYAVDDIVVEMPSSRLPDALITAAEQLRGVRVDAIRPYTGVLDTHRELALIDQVAATAQNRLQTLADEAPRVLHSGWCVIAVSGANGLEPINSSAGAPEPGTYQIPVIELVGAQALDGEADWVPQVWQELDTALAAAPLGAKGLTIILGRPGGPYFRPAEVARLGYVAGILSTVLR
jgi:hypothetical protein